MTTYIVEVSVIQIDDGYDPEHVGHIATASQAFHARDTARAVVAIPQWVAEIMHTTNWHEEARGAPWPRLAPRSP